MQPPIIYRLSKTTRRTYIRQVPSILLVIFTKWIAAHMMNFWAFDQYKEFHILWIVCILTCGRTTLSVPFICPHCRVPCFIGLRFFLELQSGSMIFSSTFSANYFHDTLVLQEKKGLIGNSLLMAKEVGEYILVCVFHCSFSGACLPGKWLKTVPPT